MTSPLNSPRDLAEQAEFAVVDAAVELERFRGYGVIGVPFASGDLLAMRRFPASSVGPGYTSVWHRSFDGTWTMYQNVAPQHACPRAFGPAIDEAFTTAIDLEWTTPDVFELTIEHPVELRWRVTASSTPVTRVLSTVVSTAPTRVRRNRLFAAIAGRIAGPALRAGRLRLTGEVPSRQFFHADMRRIWVIDESRAVLDGRDLGSPAPLPEQVHLGDFWIPQRGLLAFGEGIFDAFDPARHLRAPTRQDVSR